MATAGIPVSRATAKQPVPQRAMPVPAMIEDLDPVVIADRIPPLPCCLDRLRHPARSCKPRYLSPLASRQHEEAFGSLDELVERRPGMIPIVGQVRVGDQPTEVRVPGLVPWR